MPDDISYMRIVLRLAARGRGKVAPNPMVGAILVKESRIIASGYHRKRGRDHAEAVAIRSAGPAARGATLYTNLEPCCHLEKLTPPCVETIVSAGIAKVVAAMPDPNPLVQGCGFQALEKGGVKVEIGMLRKEAERLNEVFTRYITSRRPFVLLKIAVTLDGKIASGSGESRWITGERAREVVHRIRRECMAVLVGIGTVLADDPLLTSRVGRNSREESDPIRVVVDSRLRIPLGARVLTPAGDPRRSPIVATTGRASRKKAELLRSRGVRVWSFPDRHGRIRLSSLMARLGAEEIASVLIEGGAEIGGAALDEGIVDKVIFFIAPKILGPRGKGAIGGTRGERLSEALLLREVSTRKVGDDLMVEGYLK